MCDGKPRGVLGGGETGFGHGHNNRVSGDPCGRSDSLRSGDYDSVAVEGIWNELGLKELGEPEGEGGKARTVGG